MQAVPGEIEALVILTSNEMPDEGTDQNTTQPTYRLTTCFSVIIAPVEPLDKAYVMRERKRNLHPWVRVRQASATEDTLNFGRLNIKTIIAVRSQLTEFETSGRFCLFVIW